MHVLYFLDTIMESHGTKLVSPGLCLQQSVALEPKLRKNSLLN